MSDFFYNLQNALEEWNVSPTHFIRAVSLIGVIQSILSFVLVPLVKGLNSSTYLVLGIELAILLVGLFFIKVANDLIDYHHSYTTLRDFLFGLYVYIKSYSPFIGFLVVAGLVVYVFYLFANSSLTVKIIVHLAVAVVGVMTGTIFAKMIPPQVSKEAVEPGAKPSSGTVLLATIFSAIGVLYAIVETIVFFSLPIYLAVLMAMSFITFFITNYAIKHKLPGERVLQITSTVVFWLFNLAMAVKLITLL